MRYFGSSRLLLILCSFACAICFILSANCINSHKETNSNIILEILECIEKFHKIQKTKEQYQRLMINNLIDRLKNMHMYNLRLR